MNITDLNKAVAGWTEQSSETMLANGADNGGIIDRAILSGTWFIVFNDERESVEGIATRSEAIEIFLKKLK